MGGGGRGRLHAWLLVFVLAISYLSSFTARGALLAVDYGSEFLKVTLVAPGKIPIKVVGNEMSKRKSPGAVSFAQGDRRLGEEANALALRFPQSVVLGARDWLGKPLAYAKPLAEKRYLPYDFVEDARGAAAVTADGQTYTAEEVVAMVLTYARTIGEAEAGTKVRDVVITVPAFFGVEERQALLDAAAIAGLDVMALVQEHAAAALQWGIDKDLANSTQNVVIYDMGSSSTTAALVRYSSFATKEMGKKKDVGQFEVQGLRWDAALGGADFDLVLVNHFVDEFKEKHGVDLRASPKSMAKLKKECRRTKEILSANKDAPISVEGIHEDIDFRSSISRETFEGLAAPLVERAAVPLKELLELTGVPVEELDAVELIGGGSRVPSVQAALSAALGGRELDRHLDSDEAIAFGAGLYAANMSTTFRVRKFGAIDGTPYPVELQMSEEAGSEDAGRKALLPLWKKIPAKRVVTVPNVTADLTITAHYGDEAPLPRGKDGSAIATYSIGGVAAAMEKHNTTGKVSITFSMSRDGVFACDKAEMQTEIIDFVEVKPPKPNKTAAADANATAEAADGNATDAAEEADADAEGGEANATAAEEEKPKEYKMRRRNGKAALTCVAAPAGIPPLDDAAVKASAKVLSDWQRKDEEKRAKEEAKNSLEGYIYTTREKLYEDEAWMEVTTDEQREAFQAALSEESDWLDFDGEGASTKEFRDKLSALKETGDKIAFRASELKKRPAAVDKARSFIELTRKVVAQWEKSKPWINETERLGMLEKVDGLDGWLAEKEASQEKLKPSEEPAFTATDVAGEVSPVQAAFEKLKRKKEPKPPKPPKNATSAAENATSSSAGAEPEEVEVPPPTIDMDDVEGASAGDAPAPGDADDGAGEGEPKDHSELRR